MVTIDGSFGEGGGQIVRTSLALALVTGQPIEIFNIRAGRKKPGLLRQHLTAVELAAAISHADVRGAAVGSRQLSFTPSDVRGGDFSFNVGTAGSATLVLQSVLPALLLAKESSTLTLEGGTHNPLAPPFDFLAHAFLPLVNQLGPHVDAALARPGFYPAGGGKFTVTVRPSEKLTGLQLLKRGTIVNRRVAAMVVNLPRHIAERECTAVAKKSGWPKSCFSIEEIAGGNGPGNVLTITVESEHVTEVFTGFGQRGVRAEQVASAAWRGAKEYLDADVPVGKHLADQLMLPLAIAAHFGQPSAFRTVALSRHSETHIEILQKFLDAKITAATDHDRSVAMRFDK